MGGRGSSSAKSTSSKASNTDKTRFLGVKSYFFR